VWLLCCRTRSTGVAEWKAQTLQIGKLRSRLTAAKLARLVSFSVITGGQASYTRLDGIHVISLGHLRP